MRHRYELTRECVQRQNKLTAICDELFPEFTQIYKDPNGDSALQLREKFPTPQAVASAHIDAICATRKHTRPGRKELLKLQELAISSIGTKDPDRCSSLTIEQRQLMAELRLLNTHVEELNELITAIVTDSREGQILMSVGCIGPIQAGILIAGIGNIANYATSAKLKGYFGWVPRQTQTGTTLDRVSLQSGGNKLLKTTIYMCTISSIRQGQWKVLYDRLVDRKCGLDERTGRVKGKMKVIGRIAGQLIKVIYTLLKKDYDTLQSLEPGQEPPAPELYDASKHKVKQSREVQA